MIRTFSLILTLLIAPLSATQAETLSGPVPAEVLRIVDGDTIHVRAHIWLGQTLEIMVRLEGIDAPEIHRPGCSAERNMANQAKAEVQAITSDMVYLHNIHRGKYAGRVVASASLPDGLVIGEHLVRKGLAVTEGAQKNWCPQDALKITTSP